MIVFDEDGRAELPSTVRIVGWLAGWTWTILAGGGGILLLLERGPLPLTNGWFALLSGISACPLGQNLLRRHAGLRVSVWLQFASAAFWFAAGHLALYV